MTSIAQNVQAVRRAIQTACESAGRAPEEVRLVAVSKGFNAERIAEAVLAGVLDIGENYVQEALPKQKALEHRPIRWHFTGHLQRNKVSLVSRRFHLIQSVDSWPLAEVLNRLHEKTDRETSFPNGSGNVLRVLLQLKTDPKAAHGFLGEDLLQHQGKFLGMSGLEIRGLMTMGYPTPDSEDARRCFHAACEIFLKLKKNFPPTFQELSMGMSGDFRIAIEEGATIVRIGRAIFGDRQEKSVP